jgi:Skp family chaperone for outer membrane proteins
VIEKKNLILADDRLNITSDIMKLLNSKIKSVKLD